MTEGQDLSQQTAENASGKRTRRHPVETSRGGMSGIVSEWTPILLTSQSRNLMERLSPDEKMNTDILLMGPQQFNDEFLSLIVKDTNVFFDKYYGSRDKEGLRYSHVIVTATTSPQIICSTGAGPCTLSIAYDKMGNAGIVHIAHFSSLDEQDPEREDRVRISQQAYQSLSRFVQANLLEPRRLLLTATDLPEPLRSEVLASLLKLTAGFEEKEVFYILAQDWASLSQNDLKRDRNDIHTIVFVPAVFSRSGRNIILLVGSTAINDELIDWGKLKERFPARNF
ncbi:hypothetical protein ISS42_02770 [Candidatus Shapirobacteria bacterium]|nr:hypothetical protein [Candidatus Shapirobacteria bacterium]